MPYPYNGRNYDPDAHGPRRLPPVGNYRVTISGAEEKRSQSSGNMMMALTVEIIEGEYAGCRMWDYVPYDDNAAQKFGRILDSCGMDPTADAEIAPSDLIGRTGMVKVRHELYKDEERAKLHFWIGRDEAVTIAPEAKAATPAAAAAPGEHTYTAADEPPTEAEMDDIPF